MQTREGCGQLGLAENVAGLEVDAASQKNPLRSRILAELFGGSTGMRGESPPSGGAGAGAGAGAATGDSAFRALATEARRRYAAALQAQRDNDWARYGEEMRRLGELLERIGGGGAGPR